MKYRFDLLIACFALLVIASDCIAEADESVSSATPSLSKADATFYLKVRVIYAGTTGIYGSAPSDLADMTEILTRNFKYPSYELSNTIRFSFFGDEEATALVFPEHFLRILSKGATKDNRLRVKAELYHVPEIHDLRTRAWAGEPSLGVQFQEKIQEGRHSPVFPIISSAMILHPRQWDAFGGIPIRVNAQGGVRSNSLSSRPITQAQAGSSSGVLRYLILGIQLAEIRK
ncbi:MAG: hypothetical protein JXR73_02450 [Candidatus Omnitrophica bacterium]|nr:hypothetical protein [Candidatus Omnitrophota bacterium]